MDDFRWMKEEEEELRDETMNVWIGGDTSVKPEDLARARWPDPDTGHSSTFPSQTVAREGAIEEQHLDDNEEVQ
ncbi:hypothetical protein HPB50_011448 [Hyalomma asiaticum]|uniref:Uncharacterized protein n=1 Tax=Hyalomma asiaticum TaxID=266040 RepID=A0ACB7SLS1_HYAAI|nr:hypothetical protein HPB50_011448 [Hyalomma asiaticum]